MRRDRNGKLIPENTFDQIGLYPGGVSEAIRVYTLQWGMPVCNCPEHGEYTWSDTGCPKCPPEPCPKCGQYHGIPLCNL
jgi:hypothetical protein